MHFSEIIFTSNSFMYWMILSKKVLSIISLSLQTHYLGRVTSLWGYISKSVSIIHPFTSCQWKNRLVKSTSIVLSLVCLSINKISTNLLQLNKSKPFNLVLTRVIHLKVGRCGWILVCTAANFKHHRHIEFSIFVSTKLQQFGFYLQRLSVDI